MRRSEAWTLAQNRALRRLRDENRERYSQLLREEFDALGAPAPIANLSWRRARHGTNSGYNTHKRLGEVACDECREAHRVYSLRAYAARTARRKGTQ